MNLHLNTRLLTLDEKYTLVTELVMIKDVQLKNTVHDLRQSLRALRLALDVAQGAGLGLSITCELAESVGCRIVLLDRDGKATPPHGTSIAFEIPSREERKLQRDRQTRLSK